MAEEKKKILVIEDEPAMTRLLVSALTSAGFQTITAQDGVQGLHDAKAYHPDLILLDIILPEMDGITMMHRLREADEWGKHVPIIVLTNLGADDDIMKAVVDNEPAYYLVKTNWQPEDVVKKVKERLGMKE